MLTYLSVTPSRSLVLLDRYRSLSAKTDEQFKSTYPHWTLECGKSDRQPGDGYFALTDSVSDKDEGGYSIFEQKQLLLRALNGFSILLTLHSSPKKFTNSGKILKKNS